MARDEEIDIGTGFGVDPEVLSQGWDGHYAVKVNKDKNEIEDVRNVRYPTIGNGREG